jgi:hypothetical protein
MDFDYFEKLISTITCWDSLLKNEILQWNLYIWLFFPFLYISKFFFDQIYTIDVEYFEYIKGYAIKCHKGIT